MCFRNFLVRKKIWIRRGCHVFPSKSFCPKLPKNIVRAPSCVSKLFWYQKSSDNRSIASLSSFFVSHRQESSRANPSVSEIFLFQNVLDNGGITVLSIVFVSQCRKICGDPSNDSKNLGHPKKFYAKQGCFTIFRGKRLVSQYQKTSWGTLLSFRKVLVRKKLMDKKVSVTFFRRSVFVPKCRKTSWAHPPVFQNYSGFKFFWIIRVSRFC